jgi:hypothetical protein
LAIPQHYINQTFKNDSKCGEKCRGGNDTMTGKMAFSHEKVSYYETPQHSNQNRKGPKINEAAVLEISCKFVLPLLVW